ncbi:MAG: hypothetical protein U0704_18500, partial [Candidatus Eisenbacteria bacterium]
MLGATSALRRLGLLLLLTATPSTTWAAWPHDAGVNVPVCTAAATQTDPISVPDGSGGAILVWADGRPASHYDLYAQRISAQGVPLWTADGVPVCTATGSQLAPRAVADGVGGAYIVWTDYRGGASADLYAQRLNASGVAQWTTNGVAVCTAASEQGDVRLALDSSAGILVSWEDSRSGTSYDIYAQKLGAAGVAQWTANGLLVCNAVNNQLYPDIATDASGGAVVTWQDLRSGTSYDIYAQRISPAGVAQWTANGAIVSTAADNQDSPRLLSDGQGGALIAWEDSRSGTSDVYVQRLSHTGTAQWTSNGLPVCTAANSQFEFDIASDGAGGAYLAWKDYRGGVEYDLYAQRIAPNGGTYWASNGVVVCNAVYDQIAPRLAPDGAGGVLVSWSDYRFTDVTSDVFAQRLSPTGTALWTSNGVAVCVQFASQGGTTVVSDGNGGAIVTWYDIRNLVTGSDIYCQRVERYGQLGNPEPTITSVGDVKNDQGGFVKVVWSASYLDADPTFGVTEYRVFRSVPGAALASALAAGRATTTDSDEAVREGKLLVVPNGATATSWEYVGTQAAEAFATYSKVVATTADSVAGSNPRTWFLVEARASTSISSDRWSSAPDSGYSVDNLPPAAPAPLTGQYLAGTTQLHWNRNLEADLAGYRLYRGSSVAFVPSPASFVAQLPDTGAADAAGAPYVYKLTAVDVHGNESPVATLVPSGTLGVETAPRALAFAAPSPNPARGTATLR